jgi:RpiR family carbohydrate utilization transcriptional regulator
LHADHIEIYGIGASSFVAFHAQQKFFLTRTPVVVYEDPRFQTLSATRLEPGDVVMAISFTGDNLDMLRAIEAARDSGAVVISITASNTPLAKRSTVNLSVDMVEEAAFYAPLTEYLAHLTLIDTLAAGIAVRRGPELLRQLAQKRNIFAGMEAEGA